VNIKGNLKLLILNSRHYLKGGSDRIYLEEMELMERNGHHVIPFARRSDHDKATKYHHFFPPELDLSGGYSFKSFASALSIIYSHRTKKCLKNLLQQETPDIAHGHNIYAHLTTSVLDVLKAHEIPVVISLHDYKFICPNYFFLDGNRICEDCKRHRYYKAIQNRCVHGDFLYSCIYSIETYFNYLTKKYHNKIDKYVAVSRFIKNKFIEYGFPEDKIVYIPNFVDTDSFRVSDNDNGYFLFIGRLSKEKGLETLVSAFAKLKSKSHRLLIAGNGPLREQLEKIISIYNLANVKLMGFLETKELNQAIQNCTCVIVPSECYENCPLAVLESFANGKPVIGARIGGIPELIENGTDGLLFESGNADDLAEKMAHLASLPAAEISQMGKAGREKVERQYNAEKHYEALISLYNSLLH